jgi:hypothetical protein
MAFLASGSWAIAAPRAGIGGKSMIRRRQTLSLLRLPARSTKSTRPRRFQRSMTGPVRGAATPASSTSPADEHRARFLPGADGPDGFNVGFDVGLNGTPDRPDNADLLTMYEHNLVYECGLAEAFCARDVRVLLPGGPNAWRRLPLKHPPSRRPETVVQPPCRTPRA